MTTYNVKFTDVNVPPVIIDQGDLNTSDLSVALFGRINLEYGDLLNEDLLHLLEHFSCPEDPDQPGTPDLSVAVENTLSQPPEGQLWFNSTQRSPFIWNGEEWVAVGSSADYAANWGKIRHNQQLPLPVSSSGYEFSYSECVWILTPSGITQTQLGANGFSYMVCTADESGLVNHRYTRNGDNIIVEGIANYVIIGIRNNNNNCAPYCYIPPPAPPSIAVTPTRTVTPTFTPSPAASATPTPTPAASATPSPTVSPTRTVTPTPTRAPSITPSPSRIPPINATLYVDPSLGMATDFGTGLTQLTDTTRAGNPNNGNKSLGVWVGNLSGGNGGPYTIFWGLTFFYTSNYLHYQRGTGILISTAAAMPPVVPGGASPFWIPSGNAGGYTITINGAVNGVTAGSGLRANAYVRSNYSGQFESGPNTVGYQITMSILSGSYVTISDSSGNTRTFYTPSGSEGQIMGAQLFSPSGNYTDTYRINV